jgi:uncharacterized MAPEG superfamily protein
MIPELWSLFAGVCLGIVHISADSFSYKAAAGNAYTASARDVHVERGNLGGRLHRAARNFTENLVLFAAVVFLLHVSGKASQLSAWASYAWVAGRAIYLPAYASGIPYFRTVCWQISMIGLVVMMIALFL